MEEACARAQIEPAVTFHELRDTFASHLVIAGVPILTVSKLLGHSDVRITEKHYAHLRPDHLQQAVDDNLPDFASHRHPRPSQRSKRSAAKTSKRPSVRDRRTGSQAGFRC
jgi:site-specific recombinase XerC